VSCAKTGGLTLAIYTMSQKMSPVCLAITDIHKFILIIFGTNVTEKVANHKVLYFSTALTG